MRKGGTGIKDDYIQIESLTDGRLEKFFGKILREKNRSAQVDRKKLFGKIFGKITERKINCHGYLLAGTPSYYITTFSNRDLLIYSPPYIISRRL